MLFDDDQGKKKIKRTAKFLVGIPYFYEYNPQLDIIFITHSSIGWIHLLTFQSTFKVNPTIAGRSRSW